MPFDPLPGILAEQLDRADAGDLSAVQLGCGDGRLLEILRRRGLRCVGLDRWSPALGTVADVVGDACRPPLRPRSLDLVIAANLIRHLLPSQPRLEFLDAWVSLLRPGGSVVILEDEPVGKPASAAAYRDLQDFLARLCPDTRGPLVSWDVFRRQLPASSIWRVDGSGTGPNTWPLDAAAVLAVLDQGEPLPGGEAARLIVSIRSHGIACGRQWWCRLRATGKAD